MLVFDSASIVLAGGGLAWTSYQFVRALAVDRTTYWRAKRRFNDQERARRRGIEERVTSIYESSYRKATPHSNWRSLVVADIVQESVDCKSFVLLDPSGDLLPSFHAGQHLLVECQPEGRSPERRCYSLSNGPGAGYYQITIKRQLPTQQHNRSAEGNQPFFMSQWMHDNIRIGSSLRVKGPSGKFTDELAGESPVVLLAAGIGITPMISMLESIQQKSPTRSIWLFYQVQDNQHEPFGARLREIARGNKHLQLFFFHSKFDPNGATNKRGIFPGKFRGEHVEKVVQSDRCHFFLCGPNAWMESMVSQLKEIGHPSSNIHWESFGGTTSGSLASISSNQPELDRGQSNSTYRVEFAKSHCEATAAGSENLLRVAERSGAAVESGCRNGSCGSCVTKLIKGKAKYLSEPQCDLSEGSVALCVAVAESELVVDA